MKTRPVLFLALLTIIALGGVLWWTTRDAAPEPRSVIEKAVEAHGGEKAINKPRMGTLRATASTKFLGEVTSEETFDLPDRWRRVSISQFEGKKRVSHLATIDGKHWRWEGDGPVTEVESDLASSGSYFYAATMLPKFLGKEFVLAPLGSKREKGRSLVGVRVTLNTTQVGDFFFDAKSGLLAVTEFIIPGPAGKKDVMRTEYEDYRDVDGVMLAFRRKGFSKDRSGAPFLLMDYVVNEVKILDEMPKDVFEIPGR